ncbi:ABC transporter ATP-binding protein [Microbispora hainanensis]|uniref:ABC transporter ATP-binding protein n=1 Tax=Microbispora hainanensis TaxID=568844 RepID=A0A544YPJ7_9ACTN|nr:ABC transporter ATP-binding protein [Microbispora hainanensis]TQS18693.1 ABC transporter ATP-binding protein [Microbispora hainanensis]
MAPTDVTSPTQTISGQAVLLDAVRVVYGTGPGAVTALDGVTLGFGQGTFTAVMGPSGSGKSTLLHCAAGLDRPTSGTVSIGGTDLGPLSEKALTLLRRERIGFVFQDYNLVDALTAAENVALPLRLAGRRPGRGEVRDALAQVGMDRRAGHRPAELSGGERQRVAIARTLITRSGGSGPAVLFADEPTGALDRAASRVVMELLRTLVDAHGQTVVMVTHDPAAAAYADRVVLLADGRLAGELGRSTAAGIAARMALLEEAC